MFKCRASPLRTGLACTTSSRGEGPPLLLHLGAGCDAELWRAAGLPRPAAWDWSPWDAFGRIGAPTLILVGELEGPEDVMGEAAALMPNATRIRVPGKEHILAFLDSDFVLPRLTQFLRSAA